MSALSDLHLEISDRLFEGETPEQISEKLHINVDWVKEIEADMLAWDATQSANASYDNDAMAFGNK